MPKNETYEHKQAFMVYYRMGEQRSIRGCSKLVGRTPDTIMKWKRDFDWENRVVELAAKGVSLEALPAPQIVLHKKDSETPMQKDLRGVIEVLKRAVMSGMVPDPERPGEFIPIFKITTMKEFSAAVKSYRECVETYHKLLRVDNETGRGGKEDRLIDLMHTLLEMGLDKGASIALLKGTGIPVPEGEPGGDIRTPGSVSEGDFEEVNNTGDQDPGRSGGVCGSPGIDDSGVEGELPEPGTPVPLSYFIETGD